jgi:hypothetical protein
MFASGRDSQQNEIHGHYIVRLFLKVLVCVLIVTVIIYRY